MKISDFIYRYQTNGWFCKFGICRIRVFVNFEDRKTYAVLTTLEENHGTSVTNMIEDIADMLIRSHKIPAEAIIVDHDTKRLFYDHDTFDIVSIKDNSRPLWKPISRQTAFQLLDCDESEFQNYHKDPRVMGEIHEAVNGIPHIRHQTLSEAPEVTERRLEIKAGQHRLPEIRRTIESCPGEAELMAFMKKDLSLIAENYAIYEDEYICFSEFPVGERRADFAVFAGRSRMNVFLIEIKGADKPLRKKNYYADFRAAYQEGIDQLQKHADWCGKHYDAFRQFVHGVRDEVNKGNRPYRAFTGPAYRLEVDPNKDINLIYVLIAGRTSDDLSDSHKRHLAENSSGVELRIETWDSWMKKLKRK